MPDKHKICVQHVQNLRKQALCLSPLPLQRLRPDSVQDMQISQIINPASKANFMVSAVASIAENGTKEVANNPK